MWLTPGAECAAFGWLSLMSAWMPKTAIRKVACIARKLTVGS